MYILTMSVHAKIPKDARAPMIALRIPHIVNKPLYGHKAPPTTTYMDRTYFLGENVKYIDYDNTDPGILWIHYTSGQSEVLYNDTNKTHTKKIYDQIIDILKSKSIYVEFEDEHSGA